MVQFCSNWQEEELSECACREVMQTCNIFSGSCKINNDISCVQRMVYMWYAQLLLESTINIGLLLPMSGAVGIY